MDNMRRSPPDWRTVEVPTCMQGLERDFRGYPVPFIVLRDREGQSHFAVNNNILVRRAIAERLCHICGQSLEETVWFVGGPGSALLNGSVGVYQDGPLHEECMRYAMQVCPHLAGRMSKSVGEVARAHLEPQGIKVLDNTTIPGTPEIFVAVQTTQFEVRGSMKFIVPKPFRKTQYWREGALMPAHDGEKAAKRGARKLAAQL